jgi:hypothetical protein
MHPKREALGDRKVPRRFSILYFLFFIFDLFGICCLKFGDCLDFWIWDLKFLDRSPVAEPEERVLGDLRFAPRRGQ